MRFLLDNNLSPALGDLLRSAGHDVVHVREIDLQRALDPVVLETARVENRVLISADTDFGTLLARTHASEPSFLLLRRASEQRVEQQATVILDNLDLVRTDLEAGSIVVIGETTARIRRLPIDT